MRNLYQAVIIIFFTVTTSAFADSPPRIQNPEKFCSEFFATGPQLKTGEMAKTIAQTIGKPDIEGTLGGAFKIFEGKTVNFSKKVIDNDFGGALRQIIYYSYIEDVGFVYFRFNFKMTGTGWMLSSFNYKGETESLFPKDFVDR